MFGASRFLWPLVAVAALPLLLMGCGGSSDPNPNTQFRPVDDEEPVAGKGNTTKPATTATSPLATEQIPAEPLSGQSGTAKNSSSPSAESTTKSSGTGKSSAKSVASPNSQSTGRTQEAAGKAPGDDPALAGSTGTKVRRMRKLFEAIGGKLEGETQQAKMQYLVGLMQQAAITADEIIADAKAPAEARDEALAMKYQVALMMAQGGLNKDAREILSQAATDLATATNVQLASLGRVQLFELHVEEVLKSQPADASEVLTALDTLLEAGADVGIVVQRVIPLVSQLERIGYRKDGVAAIAKIGAHYADSKDPNEALVGKQLQISGYVGALRGGEEDPNELGDKIVNSAKELIEATDTDPGAIKLIHQLASDQAGDFPEISTKLYDLIEEKFAENSDPKVSDQAKEIVASGRKRLNLVGKPLTITGSEVVGGDPFDWSKYRGKVVLVHFWSVGNQLSLQDIAEKIRLHSKYARRGLNIVGVNVDLNADDVERFLDAQPQPIGWPTVTGENPSQRGFKHPAAQACGVIAEALPFTVLVDKDGKIAAAGLQGRSLNEAIIKLLTAKEEPVDDKPKEDTSESEPENKDPESKAEETK